MEIRLCIDCKSQVEKGHVCDEGKKKTVFMIGHLKRMGFTKGWKPSEYVNSYGYWLLNNLDDIVGDDFIWLCDQLGCVHNTNFECINNARVCADVDGKPTTNYSKISNFFSGSTFDSRLVNNKTGHSFWYGFDYGI